MFTEQNFKFKDILKQFLFMLSLCVSIFSFSQDEALAKDYFSRGEFEKALLTYQKLYEKNNSNSNYFQKIVEALQQLKRYDEAQQLLETKTSKSANPQYVVDLGYNYKLIGKASRASEYYEKAIQMIDDQVAYGYYVARRFEDKALLDYAAKAYERTMELRPNSNYHMQLAAIYGEQGKVEKMFSHYLSYIEKYPNHFNYVKRNISEYITENSEDANNVLLRKALLKKMQTEPNILWNQLLSWLFIQQHDYNKAFAQEKAIHKREQIALKGVLDLVEITIANDDLDTAHRILDYIVENAINLATVVAAHKDKLELNLKQAEKNSYRDIDEAYNTLLIKYGVRPETMDLHVSYAHFIAFYLDDLERSVSFLKKTLQNNLPVFHEAKLKMKLADILVFQEKFNEALIYYTQIQTRLKNSTLSQEARFRVAKTSYYKGDFRWAEAQLKILKSSTSQLIANDALDLKLLISDNNFEDSLQVALKKYAKADLFAFQNKNQAAIQVLNDVLEHHKTESIIDQALYLQAKLYEKQKQFLQAETNYQKIISDYKEDILIDDAYFHLAEIYRKQLEQPEKAKELYERIIFNHSDSIYFVDARKIYRQMRGDQVN
ncbi:MAG: tetratricopeptide repeat protein [Flavobacteriaceae bacterium]|nr:tetratricopeptide repeat protein [Flavobacteriaceae bacterium]